MILLDFIDFPGWVNYMEVHGGSTGGYIRKLHKLQSLLFRMSFGLSECMSI